MMSKAGRSHSPITVSADHYLRSLLSTSRNVEFWESARCRSELIVIDDAIAIRPMVYLSFVFDHRILDGASADAFLMKVKETLENWA